MMKIPNGLGVNIEPAVAQNNADGVLASAHGLGDIVSDIENSFVVTRIAWIEEMVPDFFPINMKFVIAQAADISPGLLDFSLESERAPQERGRMGTGIGPASDPLTAPILRRKQAHLPKGHGAPAGPFRVFVPYTHFPKAARAGPERFAGVSNTEGFV